MRNDPFGPSAFSIPGLRELRLLVMSIVVFGLLANDSFAVAFSPELPLRAQRAISPPEQPAFGPGGRDYRFENVVTVHVGRSPTGAWIYGPEQTTAVERRDLPVVVFLHGFGATDPTTYLGWIEHLVRRGSLVIYPDYQDPGFLGNGQDAYLENMLSGVRATLAQLDASPERVHVVGHSLGAVLTVAYGALAPEAGLPPAATLTIIEPGGCRNCGNLAAFGVPLPLSARISSDTLVRTVVGGDDRLVGDADARAIQRMFGDIPAVRKSFESIRSDDHGSPPLVADHLFPQTGRFGGETDALDWFGLWRPFDALMTCADLQQECETALSERGDHRYMGLWSDGIPVLRPDPVK